MTCPKCNFQNPEETLVCQNCKEPLHGRKFNFWKIGFTVLIVVSVGIYVLSRYTKKNSYPIKPTIDKVEFVYTSPTPLSKTQEETKDYIHPKIESYAKYSNSNLKLSFEYPSNWILQDDSTENYGSPFVRVANIESECEEEPQTTWAKRCHYYSLFIEDYDDSAITEENPRVYIYQNLLDQAKMAEKYCRKDGGDCNGPIPGFPVVSGKIFYNFPKDNRFPAVGIETMPRSKGGENNQYFVIKNKRVYLFELSAPDYVAGENKPNINDLQHPLMQILSSLNFQ